MSIALVPYSMECVYRIPIGASAIAKRGEKLTNLIEDSLQVKEGARC